jgi:intraflagellar transport protein 80
VEFALGWGRLVVATATQCFLYATTNWNTPHIFDLRAPVQLIVLCEAYFLMLDPAGVTVYSYEGRTVSTPRFNGLRPESLNKNTVALCNDCVAILDRTDSKTVRVFDTATGKALTGAVSHKAEITHLCLSQSDQGGSLAERRIAVVDKQKDLYLGPVAPGAKGLVKLQTQVDSVAWSDSADMLCAVADARFLVWYYPNIVFVDRDLVTATLETRDGSALGKGAAVAGSSAGRAHVRRGDGALASLAVAPYAPLLQRLGREKRWDEALRLCRFVKDAAAAARLWGCLAGMALHGRHLDTAEIALAALCEVDKVEFVVHMKSIPSEEGRSAALALYRRCPDEAEAILLQAKPPLVYRAIKMNVRLFRWGRALEVAVKHKKHVDTVLGYRARYLDRFQKQETNAKFQQYAREVEVNWETIKAKIQLEKEDERARSGAPSFAETK